MATLPYSKDELSLNIKILNCRNLLVGDAISSDPYVSVSLGKKLLHKTKHLMKTLNPVFGKKDNNEFDTQFLWGDLTKKGGLTFEVKDWDLVGKDDFLGSVKVSPSELLRMALTEAPTTLQIEPPPNKKAKKGAGSITLSMQHTSTTGVKSKYWAPPRASVAIRRSTTVNPGEIVSSSDDESYDSSSSAPDYNKELIVEIISCKSLIAGDANGLSDPYVKVQMGARFLHRTAVIKKTLNPAFSAEHKNAFILDCPAKDLWAAGGIEFIVKDHDNGIAALGHTNDFLGSTKVPAGRLYQASGMNMKIKLTPPKDSKHARRGLSAGSITIRVREATVEDRNEIRERSNVFKKTTKIISPRAQGKKFIPEVDITGIDKKILLVEVLSCRELLPADKNGYSDPYVLAKLGFKDLHKTRHIKKTLNPVFTSEQRNSFVVNCSVSELFGADGIFIKVIDWDRGVISGDDELGSIQISAQTMYECQEEEYHLDPPPGRNEDAGYVTIRITEISEEQRKQHKRGKLKITKAPMPSGLSTAETGVSTTSQLSAVSQDSNKSLSSTLGFRDMPDKILLVEILSCRNLISADKNGLSDPYVRAKMGGKDLHKTDRVLKTLNPVFSSAQNNSFLITCSKSELAGAQGILVRVIDWDRGIGGDDDLGWVQVQAESLYDCRIQDYTLNAPYGRNEDAGYVTIRTTELSEEERASYSRGKLPLASIPPPPPPAIREDEDDESEDDRSQDGSPAATTMKSPIHGGVQLHDGDVQDMLKPPFDPDARIVEEEEKKFRFLVAAVVVSSVILVFLAATGITGRSARSGNPTVQIEQVGTRVGRCIDLSGWADSYGYGCDYYIENEGDCETYANNVGSDGKGPIEACCVCQNVSVASCVDLSDWIDFYEDTCDWYEENEPVGCPNEGHVNGTDDVKASEACCHCHATATDGGGAHGKWLNGRQENVVTREDVTREDSCLQGSNVFAYCITTGTVIGVSLVLAFLIVCFICCCCC